MKFIEIILSVLLVIALVWMFPAKYIPLHAPDCVPNDQDQYTFSPNRFLVLSSCLRVTGVIHTGSVGEDGDASMDLEVDQPYRFTLNVMNDHNMHGWLHLESVCYSEPEDDMAPHYACLHDKTAYHGDLPRIGSHIWAEGRWLWDLNHGGHAELHPLYRWGEVD